MYQMSNYHSKVVLISSRLTGQLAVTSLWTLVARTTHILCGSAGVLTTWTVEASSAGARWAGQCIGITIVTWQGKRIDMHELSAISK